MTGEERVKVRFSGSYVKVEPGDFDAVPCQMRMTLPGTSRLVHPVPGRPNGVDRNADILVWCECMAQTPDQLTMSRAVLSGEIERSEAVWPRPKHQRGWDVLGAVSTVLPGQTSAASSRGRRGNPNAAREARRIFWEHVEQRRAAIERRRGG